MVEANADDELACMLMLAVVHVHDSSYGTITELATGVTVASNCTRSSALMTVQLGPCVGIEMPMASAGRGTIMEVNVTTELTARRESLWTMRVNRKGSDALSKNAADAIFRVRALSKVESKHAVPDMRTHVQAYVKLAKFDGSSGSYDSLLRVTAASDSMYTDRSPPAMRATNGEEMALTSTVVEAANTVGGGAATDCTGKSTKETVTLTTKAAVVFAGMVLAGMNSCAPGLAKLESWRAPSYKVKPDGMESPLTWVTWLH